MKISLRGASGGEVTGSAYLLQTDRANVLVWQLLQVRHVDNVPLILVGKMWKGLVKWAETFMLDPRLQLANPEDLRIPKCIETADEAITLVGELHAKWSAGRSDPGGSGERKERSGGRRS